MLINTIAVDDEPALELVSGYIEKTRTEAWRKL
jgi:hypothetical protein